MQRTIVVFEDGMFSNEPMPITDICNIFCAALTGAVQDIRPQYKDNPDADKIDKELFDALNYSFSKCLELTFPEYELHPELTEEVLQMEDELLRQKVSQIPEDQLPVEPPTLKVTPVIIEEPPHDEENPTT